MVDMEIKPKEIHEPTKVIEKWLDVTNYAYYYGSYVFLVGGWATPLKNMKVNWDDYSQYMGK